MKAKEVVEHQESADGHGGHLESDTSDYEIVTCLEQTGIVARGGCRNTSTNGLEADRAEVASDEDVRIESRLQSRMFRSTIEDHVLEGQVDACGKEARSQDQAAYLHLEPCPRPRIVMHDNSSSIANGLSKGCNSHCDQESPCPPESAEKDLDETNQAEQGHEECVDAKIRIIAVCCQFDGALGRDVADMVADVGMLWHIDRANCLDGSVFGVVGLVPASVQSTFRPWSEDVSCCGCYEAHSRKRVG